MTTSPLSLSDVHRATVISSTAFARRYNDATSRTLFRAALFPVLLVTNWIYRDTGVLSPDRQSFVSVRKSGATAGQLLRGCLLLVLGIAVLALAFVAFNIVGIILVECLLVGLLIPALMIGLPRGSSSDFERVTPAVQTAIPEGPRVVVETLTTISPEPLAGLRHARRALSTSTLR